jgi:hypothetical protein
MLQKLKPKKIQNASRATIDKQVGFSVSKVRTIILVINIHMVVIQV